MHVTLADALARLPSPATEKWPLGVWDAEVMRHGTLSVEIFAPKETDFQTPHEQDEVYIIVSGSGEFVAADERHHFASGDVLFVSAGTEHRFTSFSDDFVTWVIFYGPNGGEQP